MRILILDRWWRDGRREGYKAELESRGHSVVSAERLTQTDYFETENYLVQFDMAVVHPLQEDMKELAKELDRRESFKMLVFGISGEPEYNGRVIYEDSDRIGIFSYIADLVEKVR